MYFFNLLFGVKAAGCCFFGRINQKDSIKAQKFS
jgi:hypothetical protein